MDRHALIYLIMFPYEKQPKNLRDEILYRNFMRRYYNYLIKLSKKDLMDLACTSTGISITNIMADRLRKHISNFTVQELKKAVTNAKKSIAYKYKRQMKEFTVTRKTRDDLERIIMKYPDHFLHLLNKKGSKKTVLPKASNKQLIKLERLLRNRR